MPRTRGPAVYGKLMFGNYTENHVAWSWAKGMLRQNYPRCSFKQNPHGVIAFKKGEWVGIFLFDEEGAQVSL